jgi:L-lysine 6-transaminase
MGCWKWGDGALSSRKLKTVSSLRKTSIKRKGGEMEIGTKNVHEILKKSILADGFDIVMDLEKSHGSYVYDCIRKRDMIDFFTFFASSPIGYNHPKMLENNFVEKLKRVSINKPSNSDIYTVELAEFVDTFSRIAKPSIFSHLFFVSGGALAVENGIKTAFDWKVRENFKKGLKSEKGTKVIHFESAFHGRSGYTLSLTNTFDKRKTKYFAKFDWPRFKNPKLNFPVTDEELERVRGVEEEVIQSIKKTIQQEGDDIAAIIIEPIQGEGGDNHFRGEFLRKLNSIAKESECMFILDEVQTGIGITGKMWCYEHFGLEPDIVAFGKKTQVCGIMVGPRVDEVENNVFTESSRLNSTWGGNLIDMVRCKRYLEIIEEENLIENAARVGSYLLEELKTLCENYSTQVSNVRGRGLMIAFTLQSTEIRDKIFKKCWDEGVLVLKTGVRSIRFRPPLNLSTEEADQGIEILRRVLNTIL